MSATLPDAALVAGRRNCWTCRHRRWIPKLRQGRCQLDATDETLQWLVEHFDAKVGLPSKESDGCPGYEAQP